MMPLHNVVICATTSFVQNILMACNRCQMKMAQDLNESIKFIKEISPEVDFYGTVMTNKAISKNREHEIQMT